ncbi:unnamed protein product [Prorocentrum cordatum]|uniref:Uncharacterized protein n=1 Tax=Prorocentrum cordatum TaxID=2364126 RepID=A0ABN9XX00_9DINO|nr:unnamed protein product [Polarella glacialis]
MTAATPSREPKTADSSIDVPGQERPVHLRDFSSSGSPSGTAGADDGPAAHGPAATQSPSTGRAARPARVRAAAPAATEQAARAQRRSSRRGLHPHHVRREDEDRDRRVHQRAAPTAPDHRQQPQQLAEGRHGRGHQHAPPAGPRPRPFPAAGTSAGPGTGRGGHGGQERGHLEEDQEQQG